MSNKNSVLTPCPFQWLLKIGFKQLCWAICLNWRASDNLPWFHLFSSLSFFFSSKKVLSSSSSKQPSLFNNFCSISCLQYLYIWTKLFPFIIKIIALNENFYMLGIVLSALHALFHLILTISLWVPEYYFPNVQILHIRNRDLSGLSTLFKIPLKTWISHPRLFGPQTMLNCSMLLLIYSSVHSSIHPFFRYLLNN